MATPRPSNIDFYAPRPKTSNDATNVSQGYDMESRIAQADAQFAPTIGREAAALRPMGESTTTVFPGAAGFSRPQLDSDRVLNQSDMFFDRAGGATDPMEMARALKGEASVTLQNSDINRVRAQRAQAGQQGFNAANAADRAMRTLGNIPRPAFNEGAAIGQISADQRAFLAGDRQQQSSSPMATPQERQKQILDDRKAQEDESYQRALTRTGESARVAGEGAEKREDIKTSRALALAEMKQDSSRQLAILKYGSAERRDVYASQTKALEMERQDAIDDGNREAILESNKNLSSHNAQLAIQELVHKGATESQMKEAEEREFLRQKELGYIANRAEWNQSLLQANSQMIKEAAEKMTDSNISDEERAIALSTMARSTRGLGVPTAPEAPQQAPAEQMQESPQFSNNPQKLDADKDGNPDNDTQIENALQAITKYPNEAAALAAGIKLMRWKRIKAIADAYGKKVKDQVTPPSTGG